MPLPECPFCRGDRTRTPRGARGAYVPCPHPSFRPNVSRQPGGDYARSMLGVDITQGYPAAEDVMAIDQGIVVILERHYTLADGTWFAESEAAVRAAHRAIGKCLASLAPLVI